MLHSFKPFNNFGHQVLIGGYAFGVVLQLHSNFQVVGIRILDYRMRRIIRLSATRRIISKDWIMSASRTIFQPCQKKPHQS